MPVPRALAVNPANTEQAMVLWSDGRVVPKGPGTPDPHFNANWDRGSWINIGRDLIVTDWTTPSGYVMAGWGSIQAFGAATIANAAGIKAPDYKIRNDFWCRLVMDPGGSGAGYQCSNTGLIHDFGGAPAVTSYPASVLPGGLAGFGFNAVRGFALDWATKKYIILDAYGHLHVGGGLAAITSYTYPTKKYNTTDLSHGGTSHRVLRDTARAIQVVDWGSTPKGYVLDMHGGITSFGGALTPAKKPYWVGDYGRDLIIDSYPTAFQYSVLDLLGRVHLVTADTPPVVTVTSPTNGSTVTGTTRPLISWSIADTQSDPQAKATVRLFTATQYGIGGFNPATSPCTFEAEFSEELTRTVEVSNDLTNGSYRAYVMVEESLGLASSWAYTQFALTVTRPTAPTMTLTPNPSDTLVGGNPPHIGIAIVVTGLDYSAYNIEGQIAESSTGPWTTIDRLVTDGTWSLISGTSSATFTDDEIPLGTTRWYRFRYNDEVPGSYIAGAWSTAASSSVSDSGYWLSAPDLKDVNGWGTYAKASIASFDETVGRRMGTFRPLGTDNSVVVQDTGSWTEFSVEFTTTAVTEEAMKTILDQRRVLLRMPDGTTRYAVVNGSYSYEMEQAKPFLHHISAAFVTVAGD